MADDLRTRAGKALYEHDRVVTDTETWDSLRSSERESYRLAVDAVLAEVRAELLAIADEYENPTRMDDGSIYRLRSDAATYARKFADRIAPEGCQR